jgi:hypothetical protein
VSGRRKRQKREAAAAEAALDALRPTAPMFLVKYGFKCDDCGLAMNEGLAADGETLHYRDPGACQRCYGSRVSTTIGYQLTNAEEYQNLDGVQFRLRHGTPTGKPALEHIWKNEIYRETGELHRYERTFDRDRDLYSKQYINLVTGEVVVHEIEPLTTHVGRGSARQKPCSEE